jgi:glycosyltransferase involved in cell wall biosynthesis
MAHRVHHVITGLGRGGAESTLARWLCNPPNPEFEHSVTALGTGEPLAPVLRRCGVPVQVLGMRPGRPSFLGSLRLVRDARARRPSLIQGWMYHGNLAAATAARTARGRVPLLWNIRQSLPDMGREKRSTARAITLGARLAGRADRIVYNSRRSAADHERVGYPAEKSVVILNGFDTERFHPSPLDRAWLRETLGLDPKTTLIGLLGRYHPIKGHEVFLDAAAVLAAEQPTVHFLMAGPGVDASNAALTGAIERLGLGGRAHLLGERSDAERVTAALDIASCTSWAESFPNVVGEAMACGVPCVVTDVGDVAELLGHCGSVVRAGDAPAVAAAWSRWLAADLADRAAASKAARARIVEHFGLAGMVERYHALYEQVLTEADAGRGATARGSRRTG